MPTPEIVTLAEAKQYLRVDHSDEDAMISMLIVSATEAALVYADGYDPDTDEQPTRLKLAILAHVARAYDNREDGADAPPSSGRLLMPLRDMEV